MHICFVRRYEWFSKNVVLNTHVESVCPETEGIAAGWQAAEIFCKSLPL